MSRLEAKAVRQAGFSPQKFTVGALSSRTKKLATLTGRAPELCGWALCPVLRPGLVLLLSSVPGLCALCPGLVLLLSAVAGLSVQALSSSCLFPSRLLKRWPGEGVFGSKKAISGHLLYAWFERVLETFSLGRAPELCGWALWPGSASGSCPPLVLVLAAPLNSVAGLCGPASWRGAWRNK